MQAENFKIISVEKSIYTNILGLICEINRIIYQILKTVLPLFFWIDIFYCTLGLSNCLHEQVNRNGLIANFKLGGYLNADPI